MSTGSFNNFLGSNSNTTDIASETTLDKVYDQLNSGETDVNITNASLSVSVSSLTLTDVDFTTTQTELLGVDDVNSQAILTTIDTDTGVIAGDTTSLDSKIPSQGQAIMASSLPVVISSDQSNINISDGEQFRDSLNLRGDTWYPMSSDNLARPGFWDYMSTFTTTTLNQRGLRIFNGTSQSASVRGNYIYPQIQGARTLYIFTFSPYSNGNNIGDGIIVNLGLRKLKDNNDSGYSRFVFDSSGDLEIHYTDKTTTYSVNKSAFNIDVLDGTGPSGYTFEDRHIQSYFIMEDNNYSGRWIYGIIKNGQMFPVHSLDTYGLSYFELANYNNAWEINVSGTFVINSGVELMCMSSFISFPFNFDSLKMIGYNRSYDLGSQTVLASTTTCIFSVQYQSTDPTDIGMSWLRAISVDSSIGACQLLIYRIADTITISGGSASTIGNLSINKTPTPSGTPTNDQLIYSRYIRETGEHELSNLSWKNLGYNDSDTRILLLVYVKNFETSNTTILSDISWMEF